MAERASSKKAKQPKKWARVKHAGAHGLRRGAWYMVLTDTTPTIVVLDVNKKAVPADRTLLEFTSEKPHKWSVVRHDAKDGAPGRASQAGLGMLYGVCPSCRGRAKLAPDDTQKKCPVCDLLFEIDWGSSC
jgi:hypothetical protein